MRITQAEASKAAGLSGRTYTDIDRGTVNMRNNRILHIYDALQLTHDAIFVREDGGLSLKQSELF